MRSMICFALLLVSSLSTFVTAAPPFDRREFRQRRRCGVHRSAAQRMSAEKSFQTHRLPPGPENATATLDVYFHVVYANETYEGGWVTDEQIEQQMEVMNKAYNTTGLSFNLVNVSRIENEEWFTRLGPESPEESEMKLAHRHGNSSTLNVWTVGFQEGEGQGLLGYATFPADYEGKPTMDGVVLLYSTMPGGQKPPYNKGMTLVHEAGHWGGLYHTFEGGCAGNGDYVDDTPPEADAAYGCPKKRSTCPGGKKDPVTNYMDYSDDACMTGFTEGQATRLRAHMRAFRAISI
jgi:hypothetical protein